MEHAQTKEIIGVVGGLGPLASAEFLKTIYEYQIGDMEQTAPVVIVYSDPTFPDRTDTFLNGDHEFLLQKLIQSLTHLSDLGASKIIICCMTMHYIVPKLPDPLRNRVISLPDVVLEKTIDLKQKQLLLCTSGTRKLDIFQRRPLWQKAKDYIVFLDEYDQDQLHRWIYQVLKRNGPVERIIPFLDELIAKYQADSLVAGCTEIHLVSRYAVHRRSTSRAYGYLDPLVVIAQEMMENTL